MLIVAEDAREPATPAARRPAAAADASAFCRVVLSVPTFTFPVAVTTALLAMELSTRLVLETVASVADTPISRPPELAPA